MTFIELFMQKNIIMKINNYQKNFNESPCKCVSKRVKPLTQNALENAPLGILQHSAINIVATNLKKNKNKKKTTRIIQ